MKLCVDKFKQITMTPKEKAIELVDKFLQYTPVEFEYEYAIQCALIAVDEIMLAIPDASDDDSLYNHELKYWQEVNQEINNLKNESL